VPVSPTFFSPSGPCPSPIADPTIPRRSTVLLLQITSAVTAIAIVVLAIYLIPVMSELKKTATALRSVAETMQVELQPLIKELRQTVADVQVVTGATAANVDGVNLLLEELGHAGHNIRMINRVIGVASQVVATSSAWISGAKVAGQFIADKLIKKKGGDFHGKG
jgi:uncharacterized protein YoxC